VLQVQRIVDSRERLSHSLSPSPSLSLSLSLSFLRCLHTHTHTHTHAHRAHVVRTMSAGLYFPAVQETLERLVLSDDSPDSGVLWLSPDTGIQLKIGLFDLCILGLF